MGGTFSSTTGLAIDTSTGVIDVSESLEGSYLVIYTIGGVCANNSTATVTIENCNPCLASQYYSGAILTGIYQTSNIIGTNALIQVGSDVGLFSNCIEMDAEFEVELGAEFLAEPVPSGNFEEENQNK